MDTNITISKAEKDILISCVKARRDHHMSEAALYRLQLSRFSELVTNLLQRKLSGITKDHLKYHECCANDFERLLTKLLH